MSDIKINKLTGQIAVPVDGGFKVYEKGQYKQNSITGEYAVPSDDGQWHVFAGPFTPEDDGRGANTGLIQADQPGYGDQLLRQAGLAARYGVEGLTAFPAMVGNAANSTVNLGIKGINGAAGTNIPYLQKPSDMISQGLTDAGVPNPETATERVVSYPSRALAGTGGTKLIGDIAAKVPGAVSGMADLAQGLIPQAAGAVGGGLAQGATAEVTDNPLMQMAAGLAGGAVGGAAAGRMGQSSAPKTPLASTQEVKAEAQKFFKAAEDTQAILRPGALQKLSAQADEAATEFGFLPEMQPRVASVLNYLNKIKQENISIKGMMALRKMAQNAAKSPDDAERTLGGQIMAALDDSMETLGPDDVLQGNASLAASAWSEGRRLWSQYRKSRTVDEATNNADLQTASSGSGGNTDNALRQKFKAILTNEKARRGFTKDELAAMEDVVRGRGGANALRVVGKLSPLGGGLMAALGLGAVATGGPLAAIPVAGMIAKPLADRATRANVNALSGLIRTGGRYAEPSLPAANQLPSASLLGLIPNMQQQNGLLGIAPPTRR